MKTFYLSLTLTLIFFTGTLCQEDPAPTEDYIDPLQFVREQREKDEQFRKQETQTEYPNGVNVIPGEAESDYPVLSKVERSSFSCIGRPVGFYADAELRCQVWHICDEGQRQQSFLCTNGTIYNQAKRVCDWWYNVNCDPNVVNSYYERNKELYTDEEVHYVRNKEAAQKGSEQFITKPTPTKSSSELLFLQHTQREQNRKAQEVDDRDHQDRNDRNRNDRNQQERNERNQQERNDRNQQERNDRNQQERERNERNQQERERNERNQQERERNERNQQERNDRNQQERNEPNRNYQSNEEERRSPSATPTTIIISRGSAPPIIVRGPQGPPPERKAENQNQQPRRRPQEPEPDSRHKQLLEEVKALQAQATIARSAQQQGNQGRQVPESFRPSPEAGRNHQQGQFRPQQSEGFRPSPEENVRAQQPESFRPVQPDNFRPQPQSSQQRAESVRPPHYQPQQRPENQRPPPPPQQRPENQRPPPPPQQRPENQRSQPPPQQRPENQRPPPPPQQRPENQRPPPPPQQKPDNYRPAQQQRPEGLRSQENLRPQQQNEPQRPNQPPPPPPHPVQKVAKPSFAQDPNIVHQSKFRHSTPRKHNVKFASSSRSLDDDDNKERQVPEESQHPRYTYNINDFYQHKRVEVPTPIPTRTINYFSPSEYKNNNNNNDNARRFENNNADEQPRRRVTSPISDGPTSQTIPIIPDHRNKQPSRHRPDVVRLQLSAGLSGQPYQEKPFQQQEQEQSPSVPDPVYDSTEEQQRTRPTPPVVILVTKPAPSFENKKIQVTHKFVVVKAKPTPEPAEWAGKEIILNKNSEPIGSRVVKERFSQKKVAYVPTTEPTVSKRTYSPFAENSEEEELIRQQFLEGSFEYGVKKSAYRRSSS